VGRVTESSLSRLAPRSAGGDTIAHVTKIPDDSPDETEDRVASRAKNLLPEEDAQDSDNREAQAAAILGESEARSAGPSGDRASSVERRTSDEATEPVD
jgi:hypothetical protein